MPHSQALCLAHWHYVYPDGRQALEDVTLSILKGEKVCLAGPNGAGKSTLLFCLAGLLKGQGLLTVDGQAPSRPDPAKFGLVFQDPEDQLFCPTLGEDLAFGPRNMKWPQEKVQASCAASLRAVGLEGYAHRSAHHLSGGEKKRAAIAAVLACQPALLAMDEPWANLDARACRSINAFLTAFTGTLLVSSQDLYLAAEVCDRLIVLEGGKIVADGPMETLLQDGSMLESHGLTYGDRCRFCFSKQHDRLTQGR